MPRDVPRALRTSKLRLGSLRATGIPAILLGTSALVLAVGMARATGAPIFVDTLRELTNLVVATRTGNRSLKA